MESMILWSKAEISGIIADCAENRAVQKGILLLSAPAGLSGCTKTGTAQGDCKGRVSWKWERGRVCSVCGK